jgi:hypothetical protein
MPRKVLETFQPLVTLTSGLLPRIGREFSGQSHPDMRVYFEGQERILQCQKETWHTLQRLGLKDEFFLLNDDYSDANFWILSAYFLPRYFSSSGIFVSLMGTPICVDNKAHIDCHTLMPGLSFYKIVNIEPTAHRMLLNRPLNAKLITLGEPMVINSQALKGPADTIRGQAMFGNIFVSSEKMLQEADPRKDWEEMSSTIAKIQKLESMLSLEDIAKLLEKGGFKQPELSVCVLKLVTMSFIRAEEHSQEQLIKLWKYHLEAHEGTHLLDNNIMRMSFNNKPVKDFYSYGYAMQNNLMHREIEAILTEVIEGDILRGLSYILEHSFVARGGSKESLIGGHNPACIYIFEHLVNKVLESPDKHSIGDSRKQVELQLYKLALPQNQEKLRELARQIRQIHGQEKDRDLVGGNNTTGVVLVAILLVGLFAIWWLATKKTPRKAAKTGKAIPPGTKGKRSKSPNIHKGEDKKSGSRKSRNGDGPNSSSDPARTASGRELTPEEAAEGGREVAGLYANSNIEKQNLDAFLKDKNAGLIVRIFRLIAGFVAFLRGQALKDSIVILGPPIVINIGKDNGLFVVFTYINNYGRA